MQVTNKYNLPEVILNFHKLDDYNAGASDITVTQLIDSPRVVSLRKMHKHVIEQDISDMLWMLMGKAMHKVLEQSQDPNTVTEERLFTQLNGWTISGQIDQQIKQPDGTIDIGDYKFSSVWAVMNDKPDWEHQLNTYSWLVRKAKALRTRKLSIYAMCRDWNRRDVVKEGYPPAPLVEIPIRLWSDKEQDKYVEHRLNIHSDADTTVSIGGELPLCTDEDQWRRKETFAVIKEGGKRALRVLDSMGEAQKHVIDKGLKDVKIEVRPANPVRCMGDYCRVSAQCSQWQEEKERIGNGNNQQRNDD